MSKKLKTVLPTMFDVEPERKITVTSSKKKGGTGFKQEFNLNEIGLNAAWKRDGAFLKKYRNNSID